MLDLSDVAHYLLSLGLVKASAVVEEDFAVADVSRRNRVFVATGPGDCVHVVKQAVGRSAATLAHEAAVLRSLSDVPELAGRVPELLHVDPNGPVLVLRTPAGARAWSAPRPAGARLLGRTLAGVHGLCAVEPLPAGVDPMWGLSLAEPPLELLWDLSAAAQDVVSRVQSAAGLCRRLGELHEAEPGAALAHGDLRWDNCLSVAAPGTRLVVIDWELAGPGRPEFDVGTVLAEFLGAWLASIPVADPRDPTRLLGLARRPLRRMQPVLEAFWIAYRDASARPPPLRSVVEMAAVSLLQAAVEHAQGLAAPSAQVVLALQLADHLLRDPAEGARALLGLRE